MKKNETTATLLPEYGRKKLLTYADSFRDLAKTFMIMPGSEEAVKDELDRNDVILQKRLSENRGVLAEHLNEMAGIMTRVAEESFCYLTPSERQARQITQMLKERGIFVKDIFLIEKKNQHLEVTTCLRENRNSGFSVDEIAGIFSVVFNRRLLPVVGSIQYLKKEFQTVVFEEESSFGYLTGIARAVKESESVSGDNHSYMQLGNGKLVASLSDGMGSGEKAGRDSEEVIDLLEKLMEAGFGKETAVQIINGFLIAGSEVQNMSTLDICDIDLYTGICEFIKIGSAATYIKRGNLVEKITSATLPLGVFGQLDVDIIKKQLVDGDYVILMSDGILDTLPVEGNTEIFRELIEKITIQNPKEIASYIINFAIHAAKGKIRDDMTVMVIGIWENNK